MAISSMKPGINESTYLQSYTDQSSTSESGGYSGDHSSVAMPPPPSSLYIEVGSGNIPPEPEEQGGYIGDDSSSDVYPTANLYLEVGSGNIAPRYIAEQERAVNTRSPGESSSSSSNSPVEEEHKSSDYFNSDS